MKITPFFRAVLVVAAIAILLVRSYAQSNPETSAAAPATAESSPARPSLKLVYKPPAAAGNIPTRVSGGARGGGDAGTSLLALVPNHAALTTQAHPSLFWFQSKPTKAKFEMTVVEPKKAKPLLSLTSSDADKPGIHRIKLSKHNVELQPGVSYEWSVAIVPDPANRSKDVVAKGLIKRISAPGNLETMLEKADDMERASVYAQAGIWYDALDAISNAIEAHPDDASLREQRATLLKQVGLSQAAALDKKK
jgi:hypothetical protein